MVRLTARKQHNLHLAAAKHCGRTRADEQSRESSLNTGRASTFTTTKKFSLNAKKKNIYIYFRWKRLGSNQSQRSDHLFLFWSSWLFLAFYWSLPAFSCWDIQQEETASRDRVFFFFFGISPSYVNTSFFLWCSHLLARRRRQSALESSRSASPVKSDFVLTCCPQKSQHFFGRLRATDADESCTSLSMPPHPCTATAADTKADLNKQPIEKKKSAKQRCIKQTHLLAEALPLSPDKYTAYNLPLPRIDLSSPCSRDESAVWQTGCQEDT